MGGIPPGQVLAYAQLGWSSWFSSGVQQAVENRIFSATAENFPGLLNFCGRTNSDSFTVSMAGTWFPTEDDVADWTMTTSLRVSKYFR